jgi:CO dehydrogenase maturation factor
MLGVDLEKEGVRTVLDVLYDIQKKEGYEELESMALPEKIEYLFGSECLYESEAFDLVSLGIKWTEGCYCFPNNLIRTIIPKLAQNYAHTFIDAPAGLEHLNRNVTSEVDDLFLLLDPSLKSMKNIERVQRLTGEIGISYRNYFLVSNHRFNESLDARIEGNGAVHLGRIDYDPIIEEYNLAGRSLLELPESSPACVSVKQILAKAGYTIN